MAFSVHFNLCWQVHLSRTATFCGTIIGRFYGGTVNVLAGHLLYNSLGSMARSQSGEVAFNVVLAGPPLYSSHFLWAQEWYAWPKNAHSQTNDVMWLQNE